MKRLRDLRISSGATQQQMANFLGISRPAYSRYETGEREPDNESLKRLADFFKVSVDFLIDHTDVASPVDEKMSPSHTEDDITFDDFSYAMYNETGELSEEEKQQLLDLARIMKQRRREREKGAAGEQG